MMQAFAVTLLQIVIIVVFARMVGALLKRFGQPAVIGEIAAGILLGPSAFGALAPDVFARVFPASSMPTLSALSQIALVLFMFLVGLDLAPDLLRERRGSVVIISQVSIAVPFVLGAALAFYLYPRVSDPSVPFRNFALFLGVAMSITAFPVLARILSDRRLMKTRMGNTAIACAAVDDVTAWCLLAVVVMLARGGSPPDLVPRFALFGAFLAGVMLPRDPAKREILAAKMRRVTSTVLPLFFAVTGLRMNVGLLHTPALWLYCGLIILVAIAGKLGGGTLAAAATGLSWREATALGVLMNTRGLMELVVLNIGLEIGVISRSLFTMCVIMALVTTAMTAPLLDRISTDFCIMVIHEDDARLARRSPVEGEAAGRERAYFAHQDDRGRVDSPSSAQPEPPAAVEASSPFPPERWVAEGN